VIARHTSPNLRENGRPGRGRPYRLVLTCYPLASGIEAEENAASQAEENEKGRTS